MPLDPEKIRQLRSKLQLTQTQLGDRAGMSQSDVARLESGNRTDPNLSTAERIARALEVAVTDICQPR